MVENRTRSAGFGRIGFRIGRRLITASFQSPYNGHMRFTLLLLLAARFAVAEFRSMTLGFEGMGCASCIESLPARMRRMRGVESAEVNAAKGVLTIKLAAGNKIRLEQVRDAIEQDGTKVRTAAVEIEGAISKDKDQYFIRPEGLAVTYELRGQGLKEGPAVVFAETPQLRPAQGAISFEVRELRAR